jgi:hypothetical protein
MKNLKVTAIFDNGGGLTLQLGNFAHYYNDMALAAENYKDYIQSDGDTTGWEGHEPEAADFEPDYQDIRNNGYKVMDKSDIDAAVADPDYEPWGVNAELFIEAVKSNYYYEGIGECTSQVYKLDANNWEDAKKEAFEFMHEGDILAECEPSAVNHEGDYASINKAGCRQYAMLCKNEDGKWYFDDAEDEYFEA